MTKIIDFHSHILPNMDDGSKSCEMSYEMIKTMMEYDCEAVVLTPHFYANRETPEEFFLRRQKSFDTLKEFLDGKEHPKMYLGAEVAYYPGIGSSDAVRALTIRGTNVLLLEMPFCHWTKDILDDVRRLKDQIGVTLVFAHIERFIPYFNEKAILSLAMEEDNIFQVNGELFLHPNMKKIRKKIISKKLFSLLGSDAHNMNTRKPNLGDACIEIQNSKLPDDYLEYVYNISLDLLQNAKEEVIEKPVWE